MKRILIMGGNGMLGHTVATCLNSKPGVEVYVSVRSGAILTSLGSAVGHVIEKLDIENAAYLEFLLKEVQPDVVINCVGVTKQKLDKKAVIQTLEANALFPQRLGILCQERGIRLLHISTDCVFSGLTGMYTEGSQEYSHDLYGVSKRMGEVTGENILTIRTSIIGHELSSFQSLVDWFMNQQGEVKGFSRAIFSGFPTVVLADIIYNHLLSSKITGIYHVSADPIDKHTLLTKIAATYGKKIEITNDSSFVLNRSLDSTKFRDETGFTPPTWDSLVKSMYEHYITSPWYKHVD